MKLRNKNGNRLKWSKLRLLAKKKKRRMLRNKKIDKTKGKRLRKSVLFNSVTIQVTKKGTKNKLNLNRSRENLYPLKPKKICSKSSKCRSERKMLLLWITHQNANNLKKSMKFSWALEVLSMIHHLRSQHLIKS